MLTVTIPVYNEEDNIYPLYEKIIRVLEKMDRPIEMIFVNDGSNDLSGERLNQLAQRDQRVKIIHLRRNFGQTAAIMAGFDHSSGEVVIPMDADLQNDPADIPRMLEKLGEGYDVVSGWRRGRKDNPVTRKFVSWIANRLISRLSGVHLHDYGCTLKAYRKDIIKAMKLYGEMHRFIPIFASWQGAKVTEIAVTHHARLSGTSKYGLERMIKVLMDLVLVKFLSHYQTRPIHVFGTFGFLILLLGSIAALYAIFLKVFENISFILTPLPLLVALCIITGGMSILLGLLAEMIMRVYFEAQNKPPYLIKKTVNLNSTL